jgi:coenzyme F420-reducing hydrogenase delta subunit
MCSGRIDPQFVTQAFKDGADGVIVLGCHPNECHYKDGNLNMLKRLTLLRAILSELGIAKERLVVDWIAAGESDKFVKTVTDIVEKIRKLGPLNYGKT